MAVKKKKTPRLATRRRTAPATVRRAPARTKSATSKTGAKRWSQGVTQGSDAMDLASGVFKLRSATAVARSLKHSAELSKRRKSTPFRSAMSMLNFEINRAGKGMPESRRRILTAAKDELRRLFHREPIASAPAKKKRNRLAT